MYTPIRSKSLPPDRTKRNTLSPRPNSLPSGRTKRNTMSPRPNSLPSDRTKRNTMRRGKSLLRRTRNIPKTEITKNNWSFEPSTSLKSKVCIEYLGGFVSLSGELIDAQDLLEFYEINDQTKFINLPDGPYNYALGTDNKDNIRFGLIRITPKEYYVHHFSLTRLMTLKDNNLNIIMTGELIKKRDSVVFSDQSGLFIKHQYEKLMNYIKPMDYVEWVEENIITLLQKALDIDNIQFKKHTSLYNSNNKTLRNTFIKKCIRLHKNAKVFSNMEDCRMNIPDSVVGNLCDDPVFLEQEIYKAQQEAIIKTDSLNMNYGTKMCDGESEWIPQAELSNWKPGEIVKNAVINYKNKQPLTWQKKIGEGTFGAVYLMDNGEGLKCALKIDTVPMKDITFSRIIDRKDVKKYNCDIVLAKQFYQVPRVMIMEIGDGTALDAKKNGIEFKVFAKFLINTLTCLVENDLAMPDMKVDNIIYKICSDGKPQFKLIDIDNISLVSGIDGFLAEPTATHIYESPFTPRTGVERLLFTYYAAIYTAINYQTGYRFLGIMPIKKLIANLRKTHPNIYIPYYYEKIIENFHILRKRDLNTKAIQLPWEMRKLKDAIKNEFKHYNRTYSAGKILKYANRTNLFIASIKINNTTDSKLWRVSDGLKYILKIYAEEYNEMKRLILTEIKKMGEIWLNAGV